MYDHEYYPQDVSLLPFYACCFTDQLHDCSCSSPSRRKSAFISSHESTSEFGTCNGRPTRTVCNLVYRSLGLCDGIFLFTAESYEPEAVAALKTWLAKTGRSTYTCGPLLPTGSQAVANEKKQSKEAVEIEEFLDNTLKASGEKSLLYVRLHQLALGPIAN